ncbi:transcription elongation factor, putative [Plasmodium knowlesi strain H]|uniref:Transcription elongation factor, putative n=3 Tax=Plasmodium knowlesi TaxID=5850 RepID=A0A5K1VTZ6_PLAKH|nr:TFIIS central domain-containing protein, putative [Plasmodium knowlesi strain H]OTN64966.1 putative Transcription elongation factor [Plasmodium knowlesi]CAA9988305.1 TFIIS central domain-containing protein, putative [Plasmodium knowlesi strain H]SBO20250.1 transcription elongation factor, putative [Plasmodium knowlesi strain H]SBO20277.1 transcription elongation factor, putative [Plasmodium knowlesi strain H]VVS77779.1 TFIIS central domain-containing protein, putative [Plasmodium knowlesi s|eukprot:XP_002259283.1 transcription elongation factor, putative [Plasmodium knowlesi strain H]
MEKKEGRCKNGEGHEKEEDGDVVEPIQFVDVNSRNIFDLDITQLDIKKVNNHMKLSDISQLYYYLNKNSFCYTSEERPYISNMLQLKPFFSSNEVENYEVLEQLKQHDARENSGMRRFNLSRVVARNKLEEKEMMEGSGGKRDSHKVEATWNEYTTVTQVGRGYDDSEADVQTDVQTDVHTDVGDEWEGDRDSDNGGPLSRARQNGKNNNTNKHHAPEEAWHKSVSSTNSCHSSESISSSSSYSFCSSTSSSSVSSSSSSLSAFSPNRTDRKGKKGAPMSNLKILDVIKKYNENLEKLKTKKRRKIKSRIGKLKKYDTVSIQGHNNKMVMSQIYKFVKKRNNISIIGQLIYSNSDCKKFLYKNIDCHMNRWNVLPCLGYLNDISEQEILHRIQVYNIYEFIYLFDEFPLCCHHNRRLRVDQFTEKGSFGEGAIEEVTPSEPNDSGACEYDDEIVFNLVQREKKNRNDQGSCKFRVFYYNQFFCKNGELVPELPPNCISINRSTGENLHFYLNSNVYTRIRDTYNVFYDPNNTYVLTHKSFEYLYFFCFNCNTYYDINIVLSNLLYSHMNGLKTSDPPWDFIKMYPFILKYKKTYDVRIKRQRVKQTDIYFICVNCIFNNVYHVMEHLSFFFYFCDIVNSRNHNFLIYNECMKNIFNVDLPFFSLYNVPEEKALLNAQKKKMPIVLDKGKNLPAHKGNKKKKNSLACVNVKRKSNRNGDMFSTEHGGKVKIGTAVDSSKTTCSKNSIGSSKTTDCESSALGAQGLVAPTPYLPQTRDRHGEVAKGGLQEGKWSSRAAMVNEEKEEKKQLAGKTSKMEEANLAGKTSKMEEANLAGKTSKMEEANLAGKTSKMEVANLADNANEVENQNHPAEESRVKGEVSLAQGWVQETFQEEKQSNKRRSDRKRKKKKEDDDELFDEGCLTNEIEEDDTFEDYLDGQTDEDIVEENQILIEEVYSGDSDFCNDEQLSGRKRRKKTGKKVKLPKRESVKGKKSATREKAIPSAGATHSLENVPGVGNSVPEEKKKEEEDYKRPVDDVNRTCNEGNLANRSISKYKKVIDKIKHALDKEDTSGADVGGEKAIDTKELSERIVKEVIEKFNDKMEIKMKLFSICSNLMRKDNAELRKKILHGTIHATDLAHMDSSDLAPISLKNKRKEHERKYFYENIYLRANFLDLKNNKNVEEEVFHHPSVILEEQQQAQQQMQQQMQQQIQQQVQYGKNHQGDSLLGGNSGGNIVNDEGFIHPRDGKRGSSSNQSEDLDPLKHGDSNGEEKNGIPSSNSNGNLGDFKLRRKTSSGNEDQDMNLCVMIPPMEKYSFEFTYQNLKGMYEHMPKYASSPILTFLDNSYKRIVAIMEASRNEQL